MINIAFLGNLGIPELILILVIILIIFGAGKLPQIGDALGKGIKNFKKSSREGDEVDVTPSNKELSGGRADRSDVVDVTDPEEVLSHKHSTPPSR